MVLACLSDENWRNWVSPFSDPNYHCAGHVSHQYPVTYPHGGWFKQMRFLLLEFPIFKHTHRDWTQCLIISISHSIHDSHPILSACCVVKHTHVYQHLKYSWLYFWIWISPTKSSKWFCTGSTDWPALLGGGTAGCQGRLPWDHTSIARWLTQYIWYVHTYV